MLGSVLCWVIQSVKASLVSRFVGGCPSFLLLVYRYAPLLDICFNLFCSYFSYSGSHVQSSLTCMRCKTCPSTSVHSLCFPCSVYWPIPLLSSTGASCPMSCVSSSKLVRACEVRFRTWVWSRRSADLSWLRTARISRCYWAHSSVNTGLFTVLNAMSMAATLE